jgi:glycogen operon protein
LFAALKGDGGLVSTCDPARRSSDLYQDDGGLTTASTFSCHDGFSLCDLVSYNEKHNEANGEGNRDGANDNNSWNCGAEGRPIPVPGPPRSRNET